MTGESRYPLQIWWPCGLGPALEDIRLANPFYPLEMRPSLDEMDPSEATTGNKRLAYAKLLGELGHHNSTPTNDHSQNDEMVGTTGRNSVEADE